MPPIPTLPFWSIVNILAPVEDATANGLSPPRPCTKKVKLDDVALIPVEVPLSMRVDVPSVLAVIQRVA